jgi:hypothetical protein
MSNKSSGTDIFVIENAILSFPHLFALDNNGKYSVALLVEDATATMIYQKAQELAAVSDQTKNMIQSPQFRWPVSKAADKMNTQGGFVYKGNPRVEHLWVMSASSQGDRPPPPVVDESRQPVMDRGQIYAGCVVAAGIRLFTYNTKGNVGVGVGLQAIMKMADGEPLGGDVVDPSTLFSGVQSTPATTPVMSPNGLPAAPQAVPQQFGQPTAPAASNMPGAPFPAQPGVPAQSEPVQPGVPGIPGLPES